MVDDEVDARELVKRLLEMAGATVSLASSASEAIERILAARPDVLVCDIGMPAEDGYSLIRQLRVLEESQDECFARGRAYCICALRGSHESHPWRVSESSLEARGTCRAARYRRQPGRSQGQNSASRLADFTIKPSCRSYIDTPGSDFACSGLANAALEERNRRDNEPVDGRAILTHRSQD